MAILFRQGWFVLTVILAGCGTLATPVWQAETSTPIVVAQVNDVQSARQPTHQPTETPVPPTATLEPTSTPTEEPTATILPTVEQVQSPIDRLVAVSDADNGEALFNTLQSATGFACSTCHRVDSVEQLIGPGLLNIGERAETRVEGQSAAEYIFNSIKSPDDYIVEGFQGGVMPQNWGDVYSDSDLFDIIAYLMTLEGEPVTEVIDNSTDDTASDVTVMSDLTELPDTADSDNGAVLFETFQPDAGFACSTCHHDDSEDRLIGPGLLNVAKRVETRVEGQSPVAYMFTSITNPGAYVVPDFPDGLMPTNWAEIYSEDEIYDIIAYLMTLE